MRILNWMQGKKPSGRKGSKRTSNSINDEIVHKTHPKEFSNWSHVLLAIGTFGDENLNEARPKRSQENPSSSLQQHLKDLTPEELNILQKEFNLLLAEHLKQSGPTLEFEVSKHCPSNIFLNRQLTFGSETTKKELYYEELIKKSNIFQHVILSKGKDVGVEANDTAIIGKRTLSLLLKKIFVCGGGTAPPAVILRTILQKKIYPRSSNVRTSSKKKYLRKKNKQRDENEDEKNDKTSDGSKWVQTDSEYIVLEI
ncbi:NGR2 [Cucumis melo var. makuwa]|uniref:NGR2 n=1 Tax=Cucumis melo var. makuwa TaxID=1194695 RepID=A0A5D3CFM8_CUCMM|nr:NGR2 [Cucumis melo var. makuwa]